MGNLLLGKGDLGNQIIRHFTFPLASTQLKRQSRKE
jgi:hypothetical protein